MGRVDGMPVLENEYYFDLLELLVIRLQVGQIIVFIPYLCPGKVIISLSLSITSDNKLFKLDYTLFDSS